MVRIVDPEPHKSVVKEVICRECGATLEYVPADVKDEMHYDYTGDGDQFNYIDCPKCANKVGTGW